MSNRILIVDDLHPVFAEKARELGFEVDDKPLISREETFSIIGNYVGIAVRTKFLIDKQLLDAAPLLRFIARAGAGLDNIDEVEAKEKNVLLVNAPEGNSDAVGEHAVGLLLSLMNNFRKADDEIRRGIWDREGNRGYELKDKVVGIIGYGFMGQSFARKLSGFGVKMIAYDKYKTGFSDDFVREVSMEEIVKHSDILSLHIPLTKETKQLINEEYFFHFKKPLFFINTSRGEIVNTTAILSQLKKGKLIGAGLDVLETEKFPSLGEQPWFEELKENGRIILTPHVAGWTFDSYRKISEVLAEKLSEIKL